MRMLFVGVDTSKAFFFFFLFGFFDVEAEAVNFLINGTFRLQVLRQVKKNSLGEKSDINANDVD